MSGQPSNVIPLRRNPARQAERRWAASAERRARQRLVASGVDPRSLTRLEVLAEAARDAELDVLRRQLEADDAARPWDG